MRRRPLLLAPLLLAGCGVSVLPTRPYEAKREWPLSPRRPTQRPARAGGRVLLVRTFRAGPGTELRGLQSLQADGSVRTDFYEEWLVPPAEAAEDALRRWLADSGLFAAVTAPGSRVPAELVLEGELTALIAEPARRAARAAVGIVLVEQGGGAERVLLQRAVASEAPLAGPDAPAVAAACREALARALAVVEALAAPFAVAGRRRQLSGSPPLR